MKQVDKVIRKGDYYEMQVVDDGLYSMKPYKKEQSVSHIQPSLQNLVTNLPDFKEARSKYYYEPYSNYSRAEPDELLFQLQEILAHQKLVDEDKQEILKIIKEIKILKEEPLVRLNNLTPARKIKEKNSEPFREVELKIKVDLSDLENKVAELERFTYPQLNSLEHQLQVLLGEKKISNSSQLPKDNINKEEIDHLFALCSSLTCAQNFSKVVDNIRSNNSKFEEMAVWANKLQETTSFHSDFLAELQQDEVLINKLEKNFEINVKKVKQAISNLKESAKK